MMAHQNPEETIETSSDFMTFQMESSSIEVSEGSNKAEAHRFLADQNKMKDFISCRNCKKEFDHVSHKPFLLPCLDAICKSCIQEISESQSYECSKCSHNHTCFQNDQILLQIDNTREIASEIFRLKIGGSSLICEMCTNDQMASHRCFDCSVFICEDCVRLHLSLKTLKSHSFMEIKCLLTGKIQNLGLSYASKYCPVAGHEKEQIKMYCSDPLCMKNVCVLCAISAHKNHNLCDITKVVKEMETKMETSLRSIELKVEKANTSIAQLSVINGTYLKNSQQLQAEIKSCFFEAKKALEKREKDLCEAVALHLKEKQMCIEIEKKKISSFISSCKEAIYYGKVSSEVNDHNNFVDIANIILPQVEILDNQLPAIEVTLDTMTFSSKSSDSCFETAVNSLGKLLVSNAYSPKSKVVVTPAACFVGQQIQFKIQLFSSTGNLIVDEDVSVCLKLNGKSFEFVNCALETSSSSFTGIWVPEKPLKISWIVVSNDIEFRTLNGVIDIRKTDISITVDKENEEETCNADCKPRLDDPSSSTHLKSDSAKIVKTYQSVTETREKSLGKTSSNDVIFDIDIPMTLRDYQAVLFFGRKNSWFKDLSKQISHINGNFVCNLPDLSVNDLKMIKNKITELLACIQHMATEYIRINDTDIDIKKTLQEIEQMKPSVCLLWNENDIEIISDSYSEHLEAKGLLQQKMFGKRKIRTWRTFSKENIKQNLLLPERTIQDTNSDEMSVSMNQSMRFRKVELKTKEGLRIKVYTGSIPRLDVDCIVNAANENLMHEGGVAAAISEAAGYQFDLESRDYVQKHGPIPVGNCGVTSAGNLPCKLVIHTVGPRWDDYRDKNRCLHLLYDSVEVTFIEADKRGMSSIAIPAISSGIFAVPRDLCVQQYYKAVMSFSRNYSFKSLREIHFVDKDNSMVRAIQEVFLLKEPPASNTEMSGNLDKKNDTPAFGAENSVSSTLPPSNAFTIVDVSENLQIKIHIGNITDIVADAIVCPQDEYCRSEDVIAKDIFRDIPDEKPVSKKMMIGNIFLQPLQGDSQWKMIIHAVAPVYDEKYAKDATKFGKALNTIMQFIMKTADEEKAESIAIPLLGTGIGEYKTPTNTCAYNFAQAVMAKKSELMFLKDIYLVLKNNEDEKIYLEHFEIYKCKIINRTLVDSGNSVSLATTLKGTPKDVDNCCICMDPPTNPKQLKKCGHIFCKECIDECFQYKPACPSCGMIYGKVTGDQPPGSITMRKNYTKLEGFNDSNGSIILTYTFDNGYQGEEHSEPGKRYRGISRSGYVPNNERGRLVAKLLNVAFSRRLVFTIGRSRTTGHDGVITWNDIHHKTRPDGGAAKFGYPDATYLDRVLEALEAKGVTEESADDPEEYKEYSKLFRY